jgi:hypothetical protein
MPPRNGTGYIGLDSWLALNRPQAAAMADSMAAGINASGQKSVRDLDGLNEGFRYGIDSQALSFDPEQYKDMSDLPGLESQATEVEKQVAAGLKGPKTLEEMAGYDAARSGAASAQRNANLGADFYGRTSLLQDQYGKGGGYSLGQQRLDSALAGAAGGDKLDAAKSQWGNLLGKYNDASAAAKSRAANVEKGNAEAAKQYRDAATAGRAKYNAELEKKAMASQHEIDRQRANGRQRQQEDAQANRDAAASGRIPADRQRKTAIDDWVDPNPDDLTQKRYRTNPTNYVPPSPRF